MPQHRRRRLVIFILDVKFEDEGASEFKPKFKVVALRECPTPEQMQMCDTPERAADYWRTHIATTPHFNPDCEYFTYCSQYTKTRQGTSPRFQRHNGHDIGSSTRSVQNCNNRGSGVDCAHAQSSQRRATAVRGRCQSHARFDSSRTTSEDRSP